MSDPSFIVWLDPGKTTGAAWYDLDADRFGSGQYGAAELAELLDSLIDAHHDRIAIGWELYINTPRSVGDSEYSQGEIAKAEALCRRRGVTVLKGQPSSARHAKSTVIFLRRLGWYAAGKEHANDAACHLFRWLIRTVRPTPQNIRKRLPEGYGSGGTIAA